MIEVHDTGGIMDRETIDQIIARRAAGDTYIELGAKFGISAADARVICESYSDVRQPDTQNSTEVVP